MKISCENKHIKIERGKGIVLILEDFDDTQKNLYNHFKSVTSRLKIPLKAGVLSYPYEIDYINFENFSSEFKSKEKFVFPIIENFFTQIKDKAYHLVLIFASEIYDLEDFNEELHAKFDKVFIKKMKEPSELNEILTEISDEIFDLRVKEITIYPLLPAVLYNWDETLTVDIEKETGSLKIRNSNSNRIDKDNLMLVFRSRLNKIPLKVEASSQEFQVEIECDTHFINPNWKELPTEESRLFINHIKNYLIGNTKKLFCSLCNSEHDFSIPFVCKKQRGDILHGLLFTGKIILKSIINSRVNGFLFQIQENVVKFLPIDRNVFEFEEMNFIFETSKKQLYTIICDSNSLKISSAVEILSNNLYQLDENKFFFRII